MKRNNRFIKGLLLVLLAAMLLVCAGCGKTENQQPQAEEELKPVYWNLERDEYVAAGADYGSGRIPRPDGYFYITMGSNGEKVELRTDNKTFVDKIDMMEAMCFDFDENGDISAVYPIEDFGYEYYNRILFVEKVEGNTVYANNAPTLLGMDFELEITDYVQVYSVTGGALLGYQPTTIEKDDELVVLKDKNGDISHIYVKTYQEPGAVWLNTERKYSSSLKASTREPDSLGYFTYTFAVNGELKTLRCRDQKLANEIDKTNAPLMNLTIDEETGLIVGKTSVNTLTGGKAVSSWYDVTYIDGNIFGTKRNLTGSGYGNTNEHTMTDNCVVVNNTDTGAYRGELTDLRVGDRIHCLTDSRDRVCYILIVGRPFDGKIAYNVSRKWDSTNKVSTRLPNENGVYEIKMAIDGVQQIVTTTDKAIVDKLDSFMCYGVQLGENNEVIKVASASTVYNNGVVASYYDVIEMDGKEFTSKRILSGSSQGTVVTYEMADDCEIYNVTDNSNFIGEPTELQLGDRVHCFRGMDNKIHLIYVVNRPWDAKIYWNINRQYSSTTKQSTRTPDADGWYWFDLAVDGKQVKLKTNEWEIVNKIDASATKQVGLLHWNGIITKVVACNAVKGYEGGPQGISWVDITGKEGDNFFFAHKYDTGKNYTFTIGNACQVYNVDPDGIVKYVGEPTKLQVGDRVHAHHNQDGLAMLVFVVDYRVAALDTEPNTCPCNENVTWQPWDGTTELTSGYYYLTNDVVAPAEGFKLEGVDVSLRLDGHTISSAGRVFWAYTNSTLNICDHDTRGQLIGSGVDGEAGGVLRTAGSATVNFWNIDILSDATTAKASEGGLISAAGKLTMQGCTFTGGKATGKGGNVFISTLGTFRAFDCTFSGGESGTSGGNIYVMNRIYLENAVVTGGSAATDGDNFVVDTAAECIAENLTLENPVNGKNMYLKAGNLGLAGKLTAIDGSTYNVKLGAGYMTDLGMTTDSQLTVTRKGFGIVIKNADEALMDCVTLENAVQQQLVYENGDIRVASTEPPKEHSSHCICVGGDMGLADHSCKEITDWKELTLDVFKTSTTSSDRLMFKESGNYYLAYDLDLPGRIDIPADQNIVICLNGCKITCPTSAFAVIGTLNITDCDGSGLVESTYTSNGGCVKLSNGGTFNLYGGTLTNTAEVSTGGGIVVVSTDGYSGLTASTKKDTVFNMYGGKLSGGKTSGSGGNVTLFHEKCYFNMYGGTVEGGVAAKNGGNINAYNAVKLLGGTITGGTAAKGADVYVNGDMVLGGKVNIGRLTINTGKTVAIHDAGLTVEKPIELTVNEGVFATNVKTDLSACFDGGAFDIVYDETAQTLSLQAPTHDPHCVCVGADLGLADHTCTPIDDWKVLTESCFTDAKNSSGTVSGYKLKEAGHYFLASDLHLTKPIYNQVDHDVTICLNGYKLSSSTQLFTISGNLTICDCVGSGQCESNYASNGGTLRMGRGGTVNIYGGTYTNLKEVTTGGAVLVVSRDNWSATGSSSATTPNFATANIYGGKLSGGKTSGNGGNISIFHTECTLNIYGGIIENGVATGNGGNLKSAGVMNLLGGTITGGSAAKGDDFYFNSGTLTIGGKLNIGKLTVVGKQFAIHDAGLTVDKPIELIGSAGVFATNVKTDLSGCFKAEDGFTVVYDAAAQTLSLKAQLHKKHCACNGADLGLAQHTCTPIDDWQPMSTDLFGDAKTSAGAVSGYKFLASGHYFLTGDLELSKPIYIQYNQDITICLNGHKLSSSTQLLTISGNLTLCDCVGTGEAVANYGYNGGCLRLTRGGTLNVYGGTYSNLQEVTSGGAVVVVSRDTYSATGASSTNTENESVFNFYGGKLSGGKTSGSGGNLTVFHAECTFNMYGGIMEGGEATGNGGNMRSHGTVNLLGGTITGGSAAKGDDVFINGGTLTIGGKLEIGSIHVNGKSFKIHDSGLTVTLPIDIVGASGTFATNVAEDLSSRFAVVGTIVYDANAKTLKVQ